MSERFEYTMQTYRGEAVPREPAAELFGHEAEAPESGDVAIAATHEGRWLAGAWLRIDAAEGGGTASIRQLVVRPEARGRGLGGRLLKRCETAAREAGCDRLRSTAGWGCPDHLAMYHRLGYRRTEAQEQPYLVSKPLAER